MKHLLHPFLAAMAAGLPAACAMAQAAVAPAAGASEVSPDNGPGLLGDIPGLATPNAPTPPAPAASAASAPPRSAPAVPRKAVAPARSSAAVKPRTPPAAASHNPSTDTERVEFRLAPVRVELPVGVERMVSMPGPFALHAPEGFDGLVQSQIIERTAYLKALAPFGSVRVVAEDLATGRQVPIDLVSMSNGKVSPRPVEVFVPGHARAAAAEPAVTESGHEAPALDMVALTRFAAQSLYAPRRLIPATPGVRPVPVDPAPVEGLYRGWGIETALIGAWRSGGLYVTAVRFTNTGKQPVDLDLQELRGRWLAATAQHTRLLASDPAWRTTTVYLVCDRPFEACR